MSPIDFSIIPESFKTVFQDSVVNFLSEQARKYIGNEMGIKIQQMRSDGGFKLELEDGIQKALIRFRNEYSKIDEDLVDALLSDPRVFENKQLQKAIADVAANPAKYLSNNHEIPAENFSSVLPERANRERVNRAIIFLLQCIAQELRNSPTMQQFYVLQYQRDTEEKTKQIELKLDAIISELNVRQNNASGVSEKLSESGSSGQPPSPSIVNSTTEEDALDKHVAMDKPSTVIFREREINFVLDSLKKGRSVWISGVYGTGKTSLMVLAGDKFQSETGIKVHKINLDQVKTEEEFYSSLAEFLGLSRGTNLEDIKVLLQTQPLLLLLDEFNATRENSNFSPEFLVTLTSLIESTKLQMVIASDQLLKVDNTNDARLLDRYETLPLSAPISEDRKQDVSEIVRQYGFTDDSLEKHAATDKPIQSVKQDKLDFKIYVNALHSFILSKYTTTPITISIDGVWGSGKSSLMSMLRGKLDPQRDGVRKLYEWFAGLRPWWRWYFGFLKSSVAKWFGQTVISLFVRKDVDEDGIYMYFGQKNKRFHKYVSDIVEGFSIDPEVLIQIANDEKKKSADPDVPNQTGINAMEKSVRWWAQVHANCEPMQPPYHYAVWLNAWKFDNQEEVWASLALATMEQIKQKHGVLWRLRFWLEITFSRFSFLEGLWQVVKQFLLPLIFAIVLASYTTIIESVTVPLDAFKDYGSPLLWAGFVISGILAVSSIFKDPFQIPLDKVFDRPNYKDKVKFLSHFEKDFARIIRAATKNGLGWKPSKLVIFIDDLDRCEPPKSADIVEAVNLFLDAEGCVFVIGMDSESVARSIEVKYKDLFERMKTENTGVVSLGRLFLDKIVQIPFSVPRATPGQITKMVEDMIGQGQPSPSATAPAPSEQMPEGEVGQTQGTPQTPASSQQPSQTPPPLKSTSPVEPQKPKVDPASYTRKEVREAILVGTKLLADNPRQVKTFINLFRLSIYIANERAILEEKEIEKQKSGLNLDKLAIWTACTIRWSGLVRHLYDEPQLNSLTIFLHLISQRISDNFMWQSEEKGKKVEKKEVPNDIRKIFNDLRPTEKERQAHWCHLPWEWWLLEPDFLKTIKSLQDLWRPASTDETDWLEVLLTMTRPIG
ncbi:MAG: hypothetical protein HY869_03935 [Chloroflexi bacterium]|nr:hypothetical protein [Chloroflexota bacterium]